MAKSKLPLILGIAAVGAGFALAAKKAGDLVTGKSGKAWRVVLLSTNGSVKTWEVFTPAGSFGPHGELSVIRYSQNGSDINSRALVGTGQGVPDAIITTAKSDFLG